MEFKEKKGLCIFIGLMILVMGVAFAAYPLSGNMGIEERFTHAVGFESGGAEEGGAGGSGFGLEGSPLLYGIVLCVLAFGIFILYRYSWM